MTNTKDMSVKIFVMSSSFVLLLFHDNNYIIESEESTGSKEN